MQLKKLTAFSHMLCGSLSTLLSMSSKDVHAVCYSQASSPRPKNTSSSNVLDPTFIVWQDQGHTDFWAHPAVLVHLKVVWASVAPNPRLRLPMASVCWVLALWHTLLCRHQTRVHSHQLYETRCLRGYVASCRNDTTDWECGNSPGISANV